MNVNRLRGIMAEQRCTQRELAKGIGISENALSNKLNGKTPFNTEEAVAICDYLNIADLHVRASIFLSEASQKWDDERSQV